MRSTILAIRDQLQLLLVHPAGYGDQHELERV
jgi:hypothetical protein